jgi:uncharacterized protein YndB with AHSA1/START domain
MATQQSDVLELEIRIEASRETVFEFFTDPAKIIHWKGESATLEPILGGSIQCGRQRSKYRQGRVHRGHATVASRVHLGMGG